MVSLAFIVLHSSLFILSVVIISQACFLRLWGIATHGFSLITHHSSLITRERDCRSGADALWARAGGQSGKGPRAHSPGGDQRRADHLFAGVVSPAVFLPATGPNLILPRRADSGTLPRSAR